MKNEKCGWVIGGNSTSLLPTYSTILVLNDHPGPRLNGDNCIFHGYPHRGMELFWLFTTCFGHMESDAPLIPQPPPKLYSICFFLVPWVVYAFCSSISKLSFVTFQVFLLNVSTFLLQPLYSLILHLKLELKDTQSS